MKKANRSVKGSSAKAASIQGQSASAETRSAASGRSATPRVESLFQQACRLADYEMIELADRIEKYWTTPESKRPAPEGMILEYTVPDNSMAPLCSAGDKLLLGDREPRSGELVVVEFKGGKFGGPTVPRICSFKGNRPTHYTFTAKDGEFCPVKRNRNDVTIFAVDSIQRRRSVLPFQWVPAVDAPENAELIKAIWGLGGTADKVSALFSLFYDQIAKGRERMERSVHEIRFMDGLSGSYSAACKELYAGIERAENACWRLWPKAEPAAPETATR